MENPTHFRKIAEVLRKRIIAGQHGYKPGDKLPPQRQLAAQLNVARDTLRDALSLLEGERLIIKPIPNQPAIIADTEAGVEALADRARNLANNGKILGADEVCEILESTTVDCPPDIAPHLHMEAGENVLCITRVVRKHGRPISTSRSYFPPEAVDAAPDIAGMENIESGRRELAASEMGSPQGDYKEIITSCIPSDEERRLLEITSKFATVLNVLRVVWLEDGRVVEAAVKVSEGSKPLVVRGKMHPTATA